MDDKKRSITLSAINVFQEKGIEKAKVSDIVKGAGIAQGTFYLYFPSKLSVMPSIAEVMVEKTLEELTKNIDEKASFKIQLEQLINSVFELTKNYREILALIYAGLASSEHLQEWEAIYEPYYAQIDKMLNRALINGEIRQSIQTKQIASILLGLIESAADQSYLYDSQNDEKIAQKKRDVFEFATHALFN